MSTSAMARSINRFLAWKCVLVFSAINLVILAFLFRYYGLTSRSEIHAVAIVLRLVPYLAVIRAAVFWFHSGKHLATASVRYGISSHLTRTSVPDQVEDLLRLSFLAYVWQEVWFSG
jgi:uncharacterized membrane protein YjjP (DUF1212 family)